MNVNLSELREHVRKGKKAHEHYSDALDVVDEVIKLQASTDDLKAEETRLKTAVSKDRAEAGHVSKDLETKRKTSNLLTTEIDGKEKKVRELDSYLAGGFKRKEQEMLAESNKRIADIEKEEKQEQARIRAKTKVLQGTLDKKIKILEETNKELEEIRDGIPALMQ